MDAFKLAAAGIICAIAAITVRQQNPEMAPPVAVAAGIALILCMSGQIGGIISEFNSLLERCRIAPEYFYTVVKLTAIAYITEFSAEICKDSGEGAIASKVQLAGKLAVLAMTAPIIGDFLNLIIETVNSV